jgi:hypothetical protein
VPQVSEVEKWKAANHRRGPSWVKLAIGVFLGG